MSAAARERRHPAVRELGRMARYWHTTWRELRRRKVIRAGAAYAVAAWIVLQLAEVVYEPLGLPAWALTWTVLAVILGFPLVAILAWFFDATASGLRRDRGAAGAAGPF